MRRDTAALDPRLERELDAEVELAPARFAAAAALTRGDGRHTVTRRREVCAVTSAVLQTASASGGMLRGLLAAIYGPDASVEVEPGATSYVLRLPCGRSATIRPGEHPAAWAQALEAHLRDVRGGDGPHELWRLETARRWAVGGEVW